MSSSVVVLASKTEYDAFVKDANNAVCVLFFWAPWSEPCKQLSEVYDELCKEIDPSKVRLAKIEAEAVPEVSLLCKIVAVPTFVFIKESDHFDRIDGAYAADLTKKVRQFNSGLVPVSPSAQTSAQSNGAPQLSLTDRLELLVNRSPVMLFMKGAPDAPVCGFSKQIVSLLNSAGAKYDHFDILQDPEVREALKTHSKWPTYPQLYINGQLIGGVDIVRELVESGELQTQLPTNKTIDDRLKELVNKSPVMIFMKGNPSEPRCKFSRALMEILKEIGVKFESFDILQDESVRQGLKEYSKWPTYPQIYAKGELVGGLDIIKELKESGELKSTLLVE